MWYDEDEYDKWAREIGQNWGRWLWGSEDLVDVSNLYTAEEAFIAETERGNIDADHWNAGRNWLDVVPYLSDGSKTRAGVLAFDFVRALQEYPLLDESDYSEREFEAFQKDIDEWIVPEVRNYCRRADMVEDMIDERILDRFLTTIPAKVSEDYFRSDDIPESWFQCAAEDFYTYRDRFYERRAGMFYDDLSREALRKAEDATYYDLIGA